MFATNWLCIFVIVIHCGIVKPTTLHHHHSRIEESTTRSSDSVPLSSAPPDFTTPSQTSNATSSIRITIPVASVNSSFVNSTSVTSVNRRFVSSSQAVHKKGTRMKLRVQDPILQAYLSGLEHLERFSFFSLTLHLKRSNAALPADSFLQRVFDAELRRKAQASSDCDCTVMPALAVPVPPGSLSDPSFHTKRDTTANEQPGISPSAKLSLSQTTSKAPMKFDSESPNLQQESRTIASSTSTGESADASLMTSSSGSDLRMDKVVTTPRVQFTEEQTHSVPVSSPVLRQEKGSGLLAQVTDLERRVGEWTASELELVFPGLNSHEVGGSGWRHSLQNTLLYLSYQLSLNASTGRAGLRSTRASPSPATSSSTSRVALCPKIEDTQRVHGVNTGGELVRGNLSRNELLVSELSPLLLCLLALALLSVTGLYVRERWLRDRWQREANMARSELPITLKLLNDCNGQLQGDIEGAGADRETYRLH